MQDKFEKEVQHKMEELKLTPSAPVWEKIELEIKDKRRKRRGIFWSLLAALILAGGGFWAYQSSQINHGPTASKNNTNREEKSTPNITSKLPEKIKPSTDSNTNTTDTVIIERQQQENINTNNKPPGDFVKREKPIIKQATKQIAITSQNNVRKITASNEVKEQEKLNEEHNKPLVPGNSIKENLLAEQKSPQVSSDENVSKKESLRFANDSAIKFINDESLPKAHTDSSLKKKLTANNKWSKTINLSAGWSSYAEGSDTKSFNANNSQLTGSLGGGNSSLPSQTSAGFGFSVGYSLSKKLNANWEVSFGVQYAYYSTKTEVGDRNFRDTLVRFVSNDVSASSYFTNSAKSGYTNRFHVVEIPVTISFKPSAKLPLYLSVGAAYGRLLSTNALTFSNSSNIYYDNSENYLRNMLPVSSSVQYEFVSKKKTSFRVGPLVQLNLLKLRKENQDSRPHLFFAGLKSTINF